MLSAVVLKTKLGLALILILLCSLPPYFLKASVAGELGPGFWQIIASLSQGVGWAAILAVPLGHPAFINWLWVRVPLLNNVLAPNLNGSYKLLVATNFPLLLARKKHLEKVLGSDGDYVPDVNEGELKHVGNIEIEAGLFSIRMHMKPLSSQPSTSSSHVIASVLEKSPRESGFRLHYVFESEVTTPRETDTQKFYGAATIKVPAAVVQSCQGDYWTNRSWSQGLNTAGRVRIERCTAAVPRDGNATTGAANT
ncbi:hypothetical protein [Salinisphaera sp. C84B14]|uniref:hypothetical protein n=1 Tax=Salinisphaera sp. C84B14 TaxID=1304155 RepID=UPI00333E578F